MRISVLDIIFDNFKMLFECIMQHAERIAADTAEDHDVAVDLLTEKSRNMCKLIGSKELGPETPHG